MDARPGEARRRGEELADPPQARRRRRSRRRRSGRAATRRCSPRSRRRCRRATDWLYEVKWDGYRALAYVTGGDVDARQPQRERPDGALRRRREGDRRRRCARPNCVARRRGLRARRAGPRELLGDAAGQAGTPLVYYVFDVLEIDGEPLVDLPLDGAAGAARRAARRAEQDRAALRGLRRRRGAASRPRRSRGSRGSSPSAPTRRTCRAGGRATG